MKNLNNNPMKTISTLMLSLIVLAMVACGGGESADNKKAELEKLKTEQAELAAKIATLQDEIAASGDTTTEENIRSKVIAITAVSKQQFVHAIDVQGKVDGDENITYSAKVPSVVTKINVKVGQNVRAGQIMAELDTKVAKAQLESAQKQYELANTVYEKRKALWDQKVGSEIEFLQAKNAKESLEKTIQSAKEGLDMYYIKADYSGTVDIVNLKVGQSAAPGAPAITVVNPDKLKIEAKLSEVYSNSVKQGDEVNARFPDIDKNVKAKVTYSSKSIDVMSRTFNVEIALPNDNDLRPNMVAELKIVDYVKANSIVVPINTIQQIDGEDVVFIAVKEGNQLVAKKAAVKVGKTYNGLAEITDGLKEGDNLISIGFQDLTNGQALKL
jgi:membrane fusion protein (multidrug efflux system)